ncbi:hypothetical protein [Streptomyces lydicus]|uniref:hypothetical protein n=1 Tax=Streptomyces lydicus TaxID=47763 RepID=UPI001F50DE62|nr:hypothetical protein [Streptomyces lydicus]MCZ1008718.1 hypothetical protein [Streptomyces lydicus]
MGFRATTPGHAIGQYLLARFDEASSEERPACRAVQAISPFSVRSADELPHPADTVRGNHPAFAYREYALGTGCVALSAQVEAVGSVPVDSLPADELHRLRSVTDRLRKMAEATLTTHAFSVSI